MVKYMYTHDSAHTYTDIGSHARTMPVNSMHTHMQDMRERRKKR